MMHKGCRVDPEHVGPPRWTGAEWVCGLSRRERKQRPEWQQARRLRKALRRPQLIDMPNFREKPYFRAPVPHGRISLVPRTLPA